MWLVLFFLVPLVLVLFMSFLTVQDNGSGDFPLTLGNYERVFELFIGRFRNGVWRWGAIDKSVWIAFITTIGCLVIGYPLAFFIATRKNPAVRQITLFLIILPFWTNFLVRTYAIQTIMGREGILHWGILLTREAVIIGLIYGYLPFMVLPIYASAERFDFRYVEAAHDLGANDLWAFIRVVLPMTLPGVIAGCILVFIPTIGVFVTPDLLGGTEGLMIGNMITDKFKGDGNQPLGSALSMVLMAMVMIALLVYVYYGDRES
jgi:spermidine/putrescine transport system permease protein